MARALPGRYRDDLRAMILLIGPTDPLLFDPRWSAGARRPGMRAGRPPVDPLVQPIALSVLDLVPVRRAQRPADAAAATIALAARADAAGLRRYWLAEHHNMPSVASTNPPVLLGILAGRTRRNPLRPGGVVRPNPPPPGLAQ